MTPVELILARKTHLARLANAKGAAGESHVIATASEWISRPKGASLKLLLEELARTGIHIKPSSFDAIAVTESVDFGDPLSIRSVLDQMIFIEIKTANQGRVKAGFGGFFFALTENEISAADQLGSRHQVALFNKVTGELLITDIPSILARSRSTTWQVSVQL
ncbi:hypothetical protein HL653_23830 (plasmid) [Sphingomonas sp. AP4-R1]|uniref:hypothetical protein n=1 Tax=Sphingomonas sp. AP4-R1 TaxID=2735134 RepID=UPI001493A428|nr:hypothetical protein [Sphingomonas sp. AP4-R1]QJU60944.1 hypothetical protein HL653_23830 [Sphingomonas sp. AP4-R1]